MSRQDQKTLDRMTVKEAAAYLSRQAVQGWPGSKSIAGGHRKHSNAERKATQHRANLAARGEASRGGFRAVKVPRTDDRRGRG